MEQIIETALREAAQAAGIVDVDALALPAFEEARALAKVAENGTVVGVAEAIAAMRDAKPGLFAQHDWAKMNDRTFAERDAELRERLLRAPAREPGPQSFAKLDAARLNDLENEALGRVLVGCADSGDRAELQAACDRLGVTT